MTSATLPTVVIVPGFRDHMPDHWQTLLAERLREQGREVYIVPQIDHDQRLRSARVANLERVVRGIEGPIVLVAHSVGCLIAVHWARQAKREVQGVLLAAPPDFDTPMPAGYSDPQTLADNGWTPMPRERLPFPSIVVASRNDPIGAFENVRGMAQAWGSRFVDAGEVGHLSPADGFGVWEQAEELVRELER
ncbi:RBBP9/YdeN family alpha/beta hydrolase [Cupriavidus consociatus]|uniref:RBBP9/YdeN family alpha/beta hydrolase n=1 Tax=Cupriavidus consociatus TaxID=2821357 RepID=UPI001AE4F7E5|nr:MULTISPECIES: alpha/beta fold hydrolase [unclassified Cupriavidus]MBP0618549.1 alpha/beta hydrolase [Cupriavidus sp. LEh25]MDK2655185.1 alpha/beta fold hydrolase [Cupriavidus sp. LEh21]